MDTLAPPEHAEAAMKSRRTDIRIPESTGEALPEGSQSATDSTRGYRELESEGVILTRGRHGSFVAEMNDKMQASPNEALAEAARAFAVRARQLGADSKRALKLVQEAFESFGAATGV
jgi:hypothetical protein